MFRQLVFRIVFFSFIFIMSFYLTYHQVFGPEVDYETFKFFASDTLQHIEYIKQYFNGTKYIPHPLWHILVKITSVFLNVSIEHAAIFTSSLILLFWFILVYYVVKVLLVNELLNKTYLYKETIVILIAFSICVIGPLVIPFYNGIIYKGVGSPNIWHNVTLWTVKPLALISIVFSIWGLQTQKKRFFVYAMVATISSILAKPSFVIIFLPSIFLLMINKRYISKINVYFLMSLITFSLLVLSYQYMHTYNNGRGGIIIDILGVWSIGSNNVPLSIFLAIAFPSLFYILYPRASQNDFLFLAWLQVLFGIILYAIFAEKGSNYAHGNFGWSYQISLSMLYLFSIIEFYKNYFILNIIKRRFLLTVLLIQVLIGIYYLARILQGQNPIYIGVFL